jgi:hypothetical protein
MELIFGTLSIDEPTLTSLLEPGDTWLLLSGFPDPDQAGHAATNFILNVRHLSSGTRVAVTGTRGSINTQPVITMTDINAAGSLMDHAMKLMKQATPSSGRPASLVRSSDGKAKKNATKMSAKKTKGGVRE